MAPAKPHGPRWIRLPRPRHLLVLAAVAALLTMALVGTARDTATEEAKLLASDGAAGDELGQSVAIAGDIALAGAPNEDELGSDAGAAYVFVRSGGSWSEEAKLLPSDGEAGDTFGYSVALDNDTAVVGSLRDDDLGTNAGAAYVFVRSGGSWTEQAKLLASDGEFGDGFGNAVAVDNDTAVVGAKREDDHDSGGDESGAAYVFVRSSGSWSEQAQLVASDAAGSDHFGSSVAVDGDTALVGADQDDNANGDFAGSAYVFVRDSGSWSEEAKLLASDGASSDHFGRSVTLEADMGIVGAPDKDLGGEDFVGSAYVFVRDGTSWSEQANLTASDGGGADSFGSSVALDRARATIGARGEEATYLFLPDGSGWTERAKLVASDAEDDKLGASVSVNGSTAVAGAPGADDLGSDAGSAYVFDVTPPAPPEDLTAETGSSPGEIDLAWNRSPDDDGSLTYRVHRSTESGGPYDLVAETQGTNYTDEALEPGERYHYVISALDDQGLEGPFSNEADAEAATTGDDGPSPDDETQDDAGTDGDASDDPSDPTPLPGGDHIWVNGTVVPQVDTIDAYGTAVSPDTTRSMNFSFDAPLGQDITVSLYAPDGTLVDQDSTGPLGGNATVEVDAGPGSELTAGTWTTVLELQDPLPGLPSLLSGSSSPTAQPTTDRNLHEGFLLSDDEDDEEDEDYEGERRCDPNC